MEKRRGAVFESKVERKWRRRRRRRLGSNARFVVRRRNSDRRLPALRQFMDAPFSLSFVLGTAHPAQCSEKAKPTREDSGVTLYSVVVTDASKEIFFLSLFLSPHENEQAFLSSWSYSMSAYVVHHIFSLYRVRRCSTYLYIYIYNVSTIFLSPSFKRRVFFERFGASMEIRFVSHLDFALYSAVGV